MTTNTLPAPGALTPVSREPSSAFADATLLIAVELYLVVAIAQAVLIWHALPILPDVMSFYGFAP